MTRDQAKKLLPLIQAYAEGAEIESYHCGSWNRTTCPAFGTSVNYRIKPKPKMVPLGPEDVPPGSVVRNTAGTWCAVAYAGPHEIILASAPEPSCWLNFIKLMGDGWEISRDGGKTWQRCEKEEQ